MEEIVVSVYCLTYNHEKYIEDAIKGFLMQKTDFRFEVWIHDDASTDNTPLIIKKYQEKYPEIIHAILQKENLYSQGKSIYSEYIKPHMIGKYVAVCEGDDYWTDCDKLQMQVDILEKNKNYSACVHQTVKINCKNGNKSLISPMHTDGIVEFKDVIKAGNYMFQLSSLVCRTEYINNKPEFSTFRKDGSAYSLSIFLSIVGDIYYINREMSVYRLFSSESSWTSINGEEKKWIENCKKNIKMFQMIDEYTDFKYKEIVSDMIKEYEYQILKCEGSKEVFLNKDYSSLRKKESFKGKIKLWLKCYMTGIYNLLCKRK